MVLGSSTQEGNTTNVNLFNSLGDGNAFLSDSLLERIQVADDNINLVNVLISKILLVAFDVASKNAYFAILPDLSRYILIYMRWFGSYY